MHIDATIHHYDDEPHVIESLRENLLFLGMRVRPEWTWDSEEDGTRDSVRIRIGRPNLKEFVLEYRIYSNVKEFCHHVTVAPKDVVLLDAVQRGADGKPEMVAERCLAAINGRVEKERLFLVSAVLAELPEKLKSRFGAEQIIRKPFDVNDVARRILQLFNLNLTDND